MKPFWRALLVLISEIGLAKVEADETVYFLVGEGRSIPEMDRKNDSYVLPLSKQEDVNYARYLVLRNQLGFLEGDRTIVVANVTGTKDNINRNFLDPKFPRWSWQVSQFLGFAEITAEVLDGNPTQLGQSDWTGDGQVTIGFWDYTIVRELGPMPLYLSVVPGGAESSILLERCRHQLRLYAGRQRVDCQHELADPSRRFVAAEDQPLDFASDERRSAFLPSQGRGLQPIERWD